MGKKEDHHDIPFTSLPRDELLDETVFMSLDKREYC